MRFTLSGILFALTALQVMMACDNERTEKKATGRSYYVSAHGDDLNDGSVNKPWKTLQKINTLQLTPGDTIYLAGGETFNGTLTLDKNDSGSAGNPIVITSQGAKRATILSGNDRAIDVNGSAHLALMRLHVIGSGRKEGNTQNGIILKGGTDFFIDSIEAQGFQKNGILLETSSHSLLQNIFAHDNGAGGILITGTSAKSDCHHITLRNARVENNPGDPTNLANHSGSGILAGYCRNVTIEYCAATNNGWDMPRIGNGPVGIWTYESDSVIIQHCISYRNKTSKGGEDGGGYDLDGGVTNSIIQYCLSYENQGSGFGIFQYAGASAWKNNTIRFNISENDGTVSAAKAGVYIWNGSEVAKDFTNCYFYNNTIYNETQAAISYSAHNGRQNFQFYNNIFVGHDQLIRGARDSDIFIGNDWLSLNGTFMIEDFLNFENWVEETGQEKLKGKIVGFNTIPGFKKSPPTSLSDATQLSSFDSYSLPANSILRAGGIDLKKEYGITNGNIDFTGQHHDQLIGASY